MYKQTLYIEKLKLCILISQKIINWENKFWKHENASNLSVKYEYIMYMPQIIQLICVNIKYKYSPLDQSHTLLIDSMTVKL
jgi:hypothetical protein